MWSVRNAHAGVLPIVAGLHGWQLRIEHVRRVRRARTGLLLLGYAVRRGHDVFVVDFDLRSMRCRRLAVLQRHDVRGWRCVRACRRRARDVRRVRRQHAALLRQWRAVQRNVHLPGRDVRTMKARATFNRGA